MGLYFYLSLVKAVAARQPDHNLIDLLYHGIAPVLGLLIAAHQRVVPLVVFLLVLRHSGIPGNQVVHRLDVDAKLRFGSQDRSAKISCSNPS